MIGARVLTAILVLPCLAGCGSEPSEEPASDQARPAPVADDGLDITRLRGALGEGGAGLSDEDVAFIHQSLIASGTEYTQQGLETFLEWELEARVTATPEKLALWVMPTTGKVNADWTLEIDRSTGAVTEGWVSTFMEPPSE